MVSLDKVVMSNLEQIHFEAVCFFLLHTFKVRQLLFVHKLGKHHGEENQKCDVVRLGGGNDQ